MQMQSWRRCLLHDLGALLTLAVFRCMDRAEWRKLEAGDTMAGVDSNSLTPLLSCHLSIALVGVPAVDYY